jgi:outer membrane autotransporter protein
MVGSTPQALKSDHDARTDQAFVDAGYRIASGRGYAEPFVSMAHVVLHNDAATESGSATALSTRSSSDVATFSTLGLRWASRSDAALWYGSLGWRHVFGFERTVATQSFAAGGSAFETVGLPMARNAIAVELGTRFAVSRNVHVEAGYTGLVAAHARDHGARITVSVDL